MNNRTLEILRMRGLDEDEIDEQRMEAHEIDMEDMQEDEECEDE
jgi:hypothetical protein